MTSWARTASKLPSSNGSASAEPTWTAAGHAAPAGVRVVAGRIDGQHAVAADDLREPSGERARAAADIEHAHAGLDGGETHERRRQLTPVAAGVPVVSLGAGGGVHAWTTGRQRVGLVARIVEPIAPNFAALRRVSSNAERA
jgi:hypothetical protein